MISLITNETCFTMKCEKCSHQTVRCMNHDRNMFILIMIETTSRGSFDHDQAKHVQNGGQVERNHNMFRV